MKSFLIVKDEEEEEEVVGFRHLYNHRRIDGRSTVRDAYNNIQFSGHRDSGD